MNILNMLPNFHVFVRKPFEALMTEIKCFVHFHNQDRRSGKKHYHPFLENASIVQNNQYFSKF